MNKMVNSSFKFMAKASWKIALIALLVAYLTKDIDPKRGTTYVVVTIFVLGLAFSIAGLFSKKAYGLKKVLLPAIVGLILNGTSLALISRGIISGYGNRHAALVAEEANKDLPNMIDEHTQRTSAVSEGNKVIYNHNLVNHVVEEMNVKIVSKSLATNIPAQLCASPDVSNNYLSKGIILEFRYFDKNDKFITAVIINDETCNAYQEQ